MNNNIDSPAQQNTIIVADHSQTLRLIVKKVLEENYQVLEADYETQIVSLLDQTLTIEPQVEASDNTLLIVGSELSTGSGLETISRLREKSTELVWLAIILGKM